MRARWREALRASWQRVRGAAGFSANGRLYESAGTGYRVRPWSAPASGPNATAIAANDVLRNRARAEARNNSWYRSIRDLLVTNLWGPGFSPHPLFDDPVWETEARKRWRRWSKDADAVGGNLAGVFRKAVAGMVDAGDAFIVRERGVSAGVPLQLRCLEAEMLPLWKTETIAPGHTIVGGVECIGERPIAYHFYKNHPGEFTLGLQLTIDLVRVDAADVLHFFNPQRAGQVRGDPWFAACLLALFDLRGYMDAEGFRKKGAAHFIFSVETPDATKVSDAMGELHDAAARTGQVDTVPGSTFVGGVGEKLSIVAPADVGPNFDAFVVWKLREICAALGVPYGLASGDMSQEVYTSHRAARLTFEAKCDVIQQAVLVPLLDRLWTWWLDEAVLEGVIAAPRYVPWRDDYLDVQWVPPRRDWIDPEKEVRAKLLAIAGRLTSRTRVIAETGSDIDDVRRELAEEAAEDEAAGLDPLVLDQKALTMPSPDAPPLVPAAPTKAA